jgi:CRP/FNR family transcriptional regulator, cyclic AMP receptor protein
VRILREDHRDGVAPALRGFDPSQDLGSMGRDRKLARYSRGEVVFSQGDSGADVVYVRQGLIKLSVVSRSGKEAVVAMLGPGSFFGEGALTERPARVETATAMVSSKVLVLDRDEMKRKLREESAFSNFFIASLLARISRFEANFVDQLFNCSEKRLARALLLLASLDQGDPERALPKISQETLAAMIGTTRSRVNFFMNRFRKLGFVDYGHGLKVKTSLLEAVLRE